MIRLRYSPGQQPRYMTKHSAAADLCASINSVVPPKQVVSIPTGVWIEEVLWAETPPGSIPELQIRARSGLAFRNQVTLANGIGTIDADYRNEICVLLINHGTEEFKIQKGDRIAQVTLNLVHRIPGLEIGESRTGGFGSTGIESTQAL